VVRSIALADLAKDATAARANPAHWLRAAGKMLALDLARNSGAGA
jgi:hypothetical protein